LQSRKAPNFPDNESESARAYGFVDGGAKWVLKRKGNDERLQMEAGRQGLSERLSDWMAQGAGCEVQGPGCEERQ